MRKTLVVSILVAFSALHSVANADPLTTKADYAYILDAETGSALYSKDGDVAFIPASMTKIMTTFVVFERLRDGRLSLNDEFKVSENAWRTGGAASGGSTMFLELGSNVSVENLLKGVIIQSGNDACIVLAEGISGSEEAFAEEMTRRANDLGLSSASFKNATGLYHDEHRISAADLAKLAFLTIQEFPEFYSIYNETEFTWNGIRQPNRNPLLGEVEGADGLKTGHLEISGYGLVGSAVRNGERRIIVLNGLDSIADRASEARRIMRAAFLDFKTIKVSDAGNVVGQAPVWLGETSTVGLSTVEPIQITLHADTIKDMRVEVVFNGPLKAPVQKGDTVGKLIISAPGTSTLESPLIAANTVHKKGLFARAMVGLGLGRGLDL